MKRKAFTLMEVIILVVIVGVLATLGIPAYQGIVEDSKTKVCQTNQEALAIALDIYIMENDRIPAGMSQLPAEYIKNAYAQILKQKDAWKLKFAYFIIGLEKGNLAYAGELLNRLSGGSNNLLICPSQEPGKNSYGINKQIKDKTVAQIKAMAGDTILIADCDGDWFEGVALDDELRFKHKNYAVGINNNGQVGKKAKGKDFEEIKNPKMPEKAGPPPGSPHKPQSPG